MSGPEQICQHEDSRRYRKWLKRVARKLMRRLAKKDPQGAPKKLPTKGYSL